MQVSFAIGLTAALVILDFLLVLALLSTRAVRTIQKRSRDRLERKLVSQTTETALDLSGFSDRELLRWYNRMAPSITLEETVDEEIRTFLSLSRYVKKMKGRLSSRLTLRRIEAVAALRNLLRENEIRTLFLNALRHEKHEAVTLYLFEALARWKDKRAIIPMIRRLGKASPSMAPRYRAILITYAERLLPYLTSRLHINRVYMGILITEYAQSYPSDSLREYLVNKGQESNRRVREQALSALCRHYPETLITEPFFTSPYRSTASYVIRAYAQLMDASHIPAMLKYAVRSSLTDQLVLSLTEMTTRDPSLLFTLLDSFEKGMKHHTQMVLARVLNNRIAYLLESHDGLLADQQITLILHLIESNHISGLVQFLNTTHNEEKQNQVIGVFSRLAKKDRKLRRTLSTYLHPLLYDKLSVPPLQPQAKEVSPHTEKPQRARLFLLLLFTLISLPLLIFFRELPNLVNLDLGDLGRLYVVRYNYLLVYYFMAAGVITMGILVLSFHSARIQNRLWRAKDTRLLFTRGLLPSVSIIAPAYNEEANIIESTNSLLNQQYPEFELIVVNDGSRDMTLRALIDYFNLEKQDRLVHSVLTTRPLRGIYTNKNIPNLIVVDKVNGGKADSLNMGLNVAKGQFFCGIDADSLLEPDALLKAVSLMLDSTSESIASGGNICPVNGCKVELGSIERITVPSRFLARFQSLEYIRSFMTGRMGWAKINLLLIISGAFGVFHRKRTIQTGGYLTKSGRYHKDTVGEDMELVVRLSRFMREKGQKYRVHYAGNANCWTEVPESFQVFRRQRDRWQRGLIDIILFHSSMLFNRRYGRLGLIGIPYYFIFELIGPFIEAQGLILIVLSALLGLLNFPVVLALFNATVLMGIMVSLTSLFISDFDRPLYSMKDIGRLLSLTIIENFGTRQLISLMRVGAYFNAMRSDRGWGVQVRTGFKAGEQTKKR